MIEHLEDAVAARNLARVEAVRLEFNRRADREDVSIPFRTAFGKLELPQSIAARKTIGKIASLARPSVGALHRHDHGPGRARRPA